MKLKSDFVTNSSSASFILYVTFDSEQWPYEEFKEELLRHIECGYIGQYGNGAGRKSNYPPDNIEQVSDNVLKMEYWTSMFNGYEDVPSCFIDLMIRSCATEKTDDDELPLSIKDVKFEVRGD